MLLHCGGEQFTVGVLIDYGSLPQPSRTHAELTRFKLGMRALTTWFAHPHVPVLLVSGPLPEGEYENVRPFEERGWIEYERRLAYLCKNRSCLWDLSGLHPTQLLQVDERRRFDVMRSQIMCKADAPLAPPSFTVMMQKKIKDGRLSFSAKGDLKVVLDLYHAGFIRIFEVYQKCDPSALLGSYAGHAWEEEQGRQLAAALEFAAQKCKLLPTARPIVVNAEGNHFGETGRRLIQQAVKFAKLFAGVRF